MSRCASCHEWQGLSTCSDCYAELSKRLRALLKPNPLNTPVKPVVSVMNNRDRRLAQKSIDAEKVGEDLDRGS